MNIKVLKLKPEVIINDESYKDLSLNSFKTDNIYDNIMGYDIVTEDTLMRIDKIALKWYGTTENIDILLKANNIFNPFSINIDDVLIIPVIKDDVDIIKENVETIKKDIRDRIIQEQAIKKININKLKKDNSENEDIRKRLKNPLPPNMLSKGDVVRNIDRGTINLTNNK